MINRAKVSVHFIFLSFYTGQFYELTNHRTHFPCKKSHKDNPQISEIMCYVCYCLQNVINEILISYVLSHRSLV